MVLPPCKRHQEQTYLFSRLRRIQIHRPAHLAALREFPQQQHPGLQELLQGAPRFRQLTQRLRKTLTELRERGGALRLMHHFWRRSFDDLEGTANDLAILGLGHHAQLGFLVDLEG